MRSSNESRPAKRRKDQRSEIRINASRGLELKAKVRCSNGSVWPAVAMNVSTHGALLQFLGDKIPSLRVDEKISVKLHCRDDVVWIAGVVRHRYANRFGICCQTAMNHKRIPSNTRFLVC